MKKTRNRINEILAHYLLDSYIDRMTYYITGWELNFVKEGSCCVLTCAEMVVNSKIDWNPLFESSPVDLKDTNEAGDTVTAIALFTAINKHKVIKAKLDFDQDLIIKFENEIAFRIKSKVKMVDYTWDLSEWQGKRIIECDSGMFSLKNWSS